MTGIHPVLEEALLCLFKSYYASRTADVQTEDIPPLFETLLLFLLSSFPFAERTSLSIVPSVRRDGNSRISNNVLRYMTFHARRVRLKTKFPKNFAVWKIKLKLYNVIKKESTVGISIEISI